MQKMKKPLSNRDILMKAVKELNDIELVFLRERILTSCDSVLDHEDEYLENAKNNPSFVEPNFYIKTIKNIKQKVDFNH